MVSEHVTGLDVEGVLDAVQTWHLAQRDLEARIFVAAAHFADLRRPGSTGVGGGAVLPGSERSIRVGGVGTPLVWEFAAAEFGARIGKSPYAGRALIADALDTRHRLPRLWQRIAAGEVRVSFARHVAQATRDLGVEAAGVVDAGVVAYADGRLTWSRFESLVAAKVVEADPQSAAERERAEAEQQFVRVGRSNTHGQKTLYVRSTAAAIIRMFASIAFFADVLAALGDGDTLEKRQAKALLVLANPVQAIQLLQTFTAQRESSAAADSQPALENVEHLDDAETGEATEPTEPTAPTEPQRFRPHRITPDTRYRLGFDARNLLPRVVLYLHLYARVDSGQVGPVVRWEGEGPITTEYVREVLGPACAFTVKPVIDLDGMAPVDAYEIPDRHREAVHLRTPADVFPFASNTTRQQQIDHTRPFVQPDHGGPPGQTRVDNLGPMTGLHHRIKTHGRWQVEQPFPGIYLWRDPHGRTYLVDHTGTRPVGQSRSGAGLAYGGPHVA